MIVILKHNPNRDQLESLIAWLQEKGIVIHTSVGHSNMVLGLVGDTSKLDIDLIAALDIVEGVKRVQEPYKNQPQIPSGGHRYPGGQHPDRRRNSDHYGGPLLRGIRGTGGGHCQGR